MWRKFKKLNFPKKSLFGFKVLNSVQSTCFSYVFIFLITFSNQFNGFNKIELLARYLYIVISSSSLIILTLNAYLRRYELDRNIYLTINFPLFVYFPFTIYLVFKFFILFLYVIFYYWSYLNNFWKKRLFRI